MTTTNIKLSRQKVIIFFDYYHRQIDIEEFFDLNVYCDRNNYDIVNVIYKHEEEQGIHYELLLHNIKKHKERLKVIIGTNHCKLPKSLISSTLLWSLQRLGLIDVYVYYQNTQDNKVTISPYNEYHKQSLISKSISLLKYLTAR